MDNLLPRFFLREDGWCNTLVNLLISQLMVGKSNGLNSVVGINSMINVTSVGRITH